jgi:hypothetical protein
MTAAPEINRSPAPAPIIWEREEEEEERDENDGKERERRERGEREEREEREEKRSGSVIACVYRWVSTNSLSSAIQNKSQTEEFADEETQSELTHTNYIQGRSRWKVPFSFMSHPSFDVSLSLSFLISVWNKMNWFPLKVNGLYWDE